jgi:hypothetical protein
MKSNVDTVSEEDLALAEVSGTLSHQVMGVLSHQLVSSRCLLWSEQAPPPFDASGLRSLIVAYAVGGALSAAVQAIYAEPTLRERGTAGSLFNAGLLEFQYF